MTPFFTTFLIEDGKAVWIEEHLARILYFSRKTGIPVYIHDILQRVTEISEKYSEPQRGRIILFSDGTFEVSAHHFPKNQITSARIINILPRGEIKIWPTRNFDKKEDEELIFCNESSGFVLEGTVTNVFVLIDNTFYTPPADGFIVDGICRKKFITALNLRGICVREEYFSPEILFSGEVFLTNALRGIMQIKMVV